VLYLSAKTIYIIYVYHPVNSKTNTKSSEAILTFYTTIQTSCCLLVAS